MKNEQAEVVWDCCCHTPDALRSRLTVYPNPQVKLLLVIGFLLLNWLAFSQTTTVDYLNVNAGSGNGVRFWRSNLFKIHMGNDSKFHLGPVTSYSIKTTMSSEVGRGWTWGILNQQPVAALSNLGDMRIKGRFGMGNMLNFIQGNRNNRIVSTASSRAVDSFIDFHITKGFDDARVSDLPIMRLTGDGKVGIGTLTPVQKLHIDAGDIQLTNYGSTLNAIRSEVNGAQHWIHFFGDFGGIDTNLHGKMNLQGTNGITLGNWTSPVVNIDNPSASVGIGLGTANPTERLEVAGTVKADNFVRRDGTPIGSGSSLWTASGANATFSGNVGIGTTTVSRTLSLPHSGQITFGNSVVPNTQAGIYWHSDSNYGIYRTPGGWSQPNYQQLKMRWVTGIILDPGAGAYGKSHVGVIGGVSIGAGYYGTEYNNGLLVQGNVGVGTQAPTEKLDVVGTVKADNFIRRDGTPLGQPLTQTQIADMGFILNDSSLPITVTDGKIGIGTSTPARTFHLSLLDNDGTQGGFRIDRAQSSPDIRLIKFNPQSRSPEDSWFIRAGSSFRINDGNGNVAGEGTSRLLINGAGNVGIGNTSPSERLDVAGTVKADNFVRRDGTPLRQQLTQAQISAMGFIRDDASLPITVTDGKIGIGTSTPARTFHLSLLDRDDEVEGGFRIDRANFDPRLVFMKFSPSTGVPEASWAMDAGINGLSFHDLEGEIGGDGKERFLIDSNGNVGIGVASASQKLDVAGTVMADNFIRRDGTPVGTPSPWITNGSNISFGGGRVGIGTSALTEEFHVNGRMKIDGNDAGLWVESGTSDWFIGRSAENLRFYNGGDRVTFHRNGNVGIGVSAPLQKLDVNGHSYFRGHLSFQEGNGRGLRFWNRDEYKIHMGTGTEYRYGPVQDYAIKMNMNNDGQGDRGWVWGVHGAVPVAALSMRGHMKIAETASVKTLRVRMGNQATGSGSNQILFSYSNSDNYSHVVKTRHNANASDGNAFDFYLWDRTANSGDRTQLGTKKVLTVSAKGTNGTVETPGDLVANQVIANNFIQPDGTAISTPWTQTGTDLSYSGNVKVSGGINSEALTVNGSQVSLNVMPGYNQSGSIRIGRQDASIRSHRIEAHNSDNPANNTLKFFLHNAVTTSSEKEVLTLRGDGLVKATKFQGDGSLLTGISSANISYTGTNLIIGNRAGSSITSGYSNVFLGTNAGYENTSGYYNLYLGHNAGYNNSEGQGNVFLGTRAGYDETGSNKLYIDNSESPTPLIWGDFENDLLAFNGAVGIGTNNPQAKLDVAGNVKATAFEGDGSLLTGISSANLSFSGYNLFLGNQAGEDNVSGQSNVFLGTGSGSSNTDGNYNLFLGTGAGRYNEEGSDNVYLGAAAGLNNLEGTGNVFIGSGAGGEELGSNKLFIDNSDTDTPLIWGDFENDQLVFNGGVRFSGEITLDNPSYPQQNILFKSGDLTSTIGFTNEDRGAFYIATANEPRFVIENSGLVYSFEDFYAQKNLIVNKKTILGARDITSTLREAEDISMVVAGKTFISQYAENSRVTEAPTAAMWENAQVIIEGNVAAQNYMIHHPCVWDGNTDGCPSDFLEKYGAYWSDYVFKDDYELPALEKVKLFIKENHHLPGVPSTEEVVKGYSIHEMNRNFLQKIEELTLYTIEQQEEIKALKAMKIASDKQFSQINEELKALKKLISEQENKQ